MNEKTTIQISKELKHRLKILCAKQDTTYEEFLTNIVNERENDGKRK